MKKALILLAILFNSCGFHSIYENSNEYNLEKTLIVVNHNNNFNTREVEAKYLNLLYKELNIDKDLNKTDYKYKIEVYLDWYRTGSVRKGSGSLARANVTLNANYLIKDSNNKVLFNDTIKSIGSLDISDSRFTNYSLENFVIDNLVASSVNDLKNKIINLTLE